MKNILLATDLSPDSIRAFERAIKLASTLASKLHILHVCPLYSFSGKKKQRISLKQDAEDMINNFLGTLKGIKNIKTSITVREGGEPYAEIIKHAEKVRAGLIVTGMHGKANILDMFVGTTIERVIRKGMRPVLMVRDKPLNDYRNVLVGTDFSYGSKQALHVALAIAPESVFHLVHSYLVFHDYGGEGMIVYTKEYSERYVADRMEDFVKENKKILKKYNVESRNVKCRNVIGESSATLIREAEELKSDLIAIGTHSNTSLMPNKIGGTAKNILSAPPCDVLVVKVL